MMNLNLFGTGIAALGLLAASFSAEAADMPQPFYKGAPHGVVDYYTWSGFYIGINGGYAWGTSDWSAAAFAAPSQKPSGWMAGGTVGFNYQVGSFVIGLESDLDWADVSASNTCALVFTCETSTSYLATFRGLLGFAFDRVMPYVTGGGAYGDVKSTISLGPSSGSARKDLLGWTVGGGLEYAFLGNWSAKIEYLYVDLGSFDTGALAPVANANVSFKESIVRVGLNYRFTGASISRY